MKKCQNIDRPKRNESRSRRMIKCPGGAEVTEEECEACGQCRPKPKEDKNDI